MNREIKFRAWHPVLKQMLPNIQNHIGNDSWAFGNLLKNGEVEVMQYTGLKDKNGVEIYEHDVCSDGFGNYCKIDWQDDLAQFLAVFERNDLYQEIGEWCIVEGNVFENPELLQP